MAKNGGYASHKQKFNKNNIAICRDDLLGILKRLNATSDFK